MNPVALPFELGQVVEQRRKRALVIDDVDVRGFHLQAAQLPDHVTQVGDLIERDDVKMVRFLHYKGIPTWGQCPDIETAAHSGSIKVLE